MKMRRHVQRSNRAAFVSRSVRLGAILDHNKLVPLCQRHDFIHSARPASEMDGDDSFRLVRDDALNSRGSDVL